MDKAQVAELHARFVWRDVTEGGVLPGFGWSQSICVAADHLRIWSDPQPDFMVSGTHGLHVMAMSDEMCLLTRQLCDASRVDFAVAASLDQVVDMLLLDGSHKVGVAAAGLLDRLEEPGSTTIDYSNRSAIYRRPKLRQTITSN